MKGRDPLHVIQLIRELGLYSSIFWTPPTPSENFSSPPTDPTQELIAATILHSLTNEPSPLPSIHPLLEQHFTLHPSTRPRLFLASAPTPFKDIAYRDVSSAPCVSNWNTHPETDLRSTPDANRMRSTYNNIYSYCMDHQIYSTAIIPITSMRGYRLLYGQSLDFLVRLLCKQ
jgi:hypothetical protein